MVLHPLVVVSAPREAEAEDEGGADLRSTQHLATTAFKLLSQCSKAISWAGADMLGASSLDRTVQLQRLPPPVSRCEGPALYPVLRLAIRTCGQMAAL